MNNKKSSRKQNNGNENENENNQDNEYDSAEEENEKLSGIQHVTHTRGLQNIVERFTEEEEEEDQDDDVDNHGEIERDKRVGHVRNERNDESNINSVGQGDSSLVVGVSDNNNNSNNNDNNNNNQNGRENDNTSLDSRIGQLQRESRQAISEAVDNNIYTSKNPSMGL